MQVTLVSKIPKTPNYKTAKYWPKIQCEGCRYISSSPNPPVDWYYHDSYLVAVWGPGRYDEYIQSRHSAALPDEIREQLDLQVGFVRDNFIGR